MAPSVSFAAPESASPDRPSPPAAPSIDELDAEICRLARRINAESYRFLVLVREFDDRFGFAKWSLRTCAEWLAYRCGFSLSAAREKVRTAHALRYLPAISAAFADGRLSYSKVRALTRVAQAHDEDLLLAYALEATASQVDERCRQMRNVAPESTEVARRAWARRSLSMWRHAAAGTVKITVEVPLEEGEVIARALDRAVAAGEVAKGAEFEKNGWHAQQADALVAVAKAYLADGAGTGSGAIAGSGACTCAQTGAGGAAKPRAAEPNSAAAAEPNSAAAADAAVAARAAGAAADHYQVIVHVDAAALRGGAGRSDLPVETVRRLTCDGRLITVVEDGNGTPLDVGRKHRTVPTALRRALWSRDRGCAFPGCRHTRFVDTHHIRHWAQGGDTSLENLLLLCTYHHRLLHEEAFRIRRDRDGAIDFMRPDGRVIPRGGYRFEDVVDDDVDDAAGDVRSSEARLSAIVHGRNPSAEVREPAGVYRLRNPSAEVSEARF